MSIRRVVVSSLGVIALLWALILPGGAQQAGIYPNSGTAFPTGMPTSMQGKFLFIATNDSAVGACDNAGGGKITLCRWISGATWTALGDGVGTALGTNLSSATNDLLSNTGTLRLGATGGTNNETLDMNCETTPNKCTVSSASGVTEVDTGTIALKTATLTTAPADDPTDSYIPATAGETAWYTGVNNDSVGDDNDCYEIRRSATPGTSVDWKVCNGAVTGVLSGSTGLPVSTGISGLASGVATFLGTPTTANFYGAVSDEGGANTVLHGSGGWTSVVTSDVATTSSLRKDAIIFTIGDGVSTITTGIKNPGFKIPWTATLKDWDVACEASGSIQIDLWQDVLANYPPDASDLMSGAGTKPNTSTQTRNNSSTFTSWTTTTFTEGSYLRWNVASVTTHKRCTVTLTVEKS